MFLLVLQDGPNADDEDVRKLRPEVKTDFDTVSVVDLHRRRLNWSMRKVQESEILFKSKRKLTFLPKLSLSISFLLPFPFFPFDFLNVKTKI